MKIGIISVNNAHNFGTCMQAYAFKEYLESCGHSVQIINHRIPKIEKSYMIYRKKPGKTLGSKCMWGALYLRQVLKKPYLVKRRKNHERFFDKYYNLTNKTETIKELRTQETEFDLVFAGSDQIWNNQIIGSYNPAFFCDFVGENTVRASYAASIGRNDLTEEEKKVIEKNLREMDYISVREENAKMLIEQLTDKEVSLVLDPTLIVNKEAYDKLLKKTKYSGDYIYVHVHHFSAKAPELVETAKFISERTGLPIVHNLQNAEFKNCLGKTRALGPEDVLTTVANAKFVITQSFHITVFSIIYQKNFMTIKRDKFSDRIENLLKIFNLEDHYVEYIAGEEPPLIEKLEPDYSNTDEIIKNYKQESIDFINKAITGGKREKIKNYFESEDKFTCYGCSACKDICPVQAIEMVEDEEGFVFPKINMEKCIECNLCRKKCIYSSKPNDKHLGKVYFSYHKEENVRENSTSGGMFAAFSDFVLNQGGYVIGVKYNDKFQVVYDIADTYEECLKFRFSKYVEPRHNDIYNKTKKALETGKPVLFTGSPCKVAGLRNFLSKDYDNLYLVEIICECSSSPMAFEKYIESKERMKKCKVTSIKFRSKNKGWAKRSTELTFEDSSYECTQGRFNVYYHCFVSAHLAKRSCYNCQFCGDAGIADITIGDFWNCEATLRIKSDDKGYSAIKINSSKGEELLNKSSTNLHLREVEYKDVYNNNHMWPVNYNETRAKILNELQEEDDAIAVFKRYNTRYKKK